MIRKDSLKSLEFDRVLHAISTYAHSGVSRDAVLDILPLKRKEEIEKRSSVIQEIRRLIQENTPLGFIPYEDISGELERVLPEGAVLEAQELLRFLPVLGIMSSISSLVQKREDLPNLMDTVSGLTGFPELLEIIERSLDDEGNVRDSASYELEEIRRRLWGLNNKINRRLEEITRAPEVSPFLQDDFITKRSGRWVIPVRMDSKGMVKGVVHDVSRTGETAFMEPLEIIGLSNELENLIAEEKAEEIRILKRISRMIRDDAREIQEQFKTLVYLDMLHCMSRFAESLRMEVPEINTSSLITIRRARHPLLMLQREDVNRFDVVPLDLTLGGDDRVMVITGPNAGGKTIAIKTVGLLLLMALSGMPVPADSSSSFPLVGELLVDIGDEQSIEDNLSTFSAHVANISGILGKAGPDVFVLMDELGTGTDPQQGAALGSAVLRDLMDKGSLVLATTHLIDIVGFVHKTAGMVNASMQFDHKTMSPLYILKPGEPGQSHALEIAEKFGLPGRVLEFARSLTGTIQAQFHSLLAELKDKRLEYERALEEVDRRNSEIKGMEARLNEKLARAEEEKRDVMEAAYREAREVVSEAKRKTYEILEHARREKSRASLKELERAQKELDLKLREFKKEPSLSIDGIKEGDTVFVGSIGYDAVVAHVDGKRGRLRVKAGDKELEVPVTDIRPRKGKKPEPRVSYTLVDRDEPVSKDINLVGLRVDEALSRIEPFLNQASLAGFDEVTVIHGIGTGTLRRAVREHLKGHPLVKSFRDGEQPGGGAGVTVIKLK